MRQGRISTPPLGAILEGITRDTIVQLARDLGHAVVEESVSRDRLYTADEVFVTGTAAEVTGLREIDFRVIGHRARECCGLADRTEDTIATRCAVHPGRGGVEKRRECDDE